MSHFTSVKTKILVTDEPMLRSIISNKGYHSDMPRILVSIGGSTTRDRVRVPVFMNNEEEPACGFDSRGLHFEFQSYAGDATEEMQGMLQQITAAYATETAMRESASMREKGAKINIRVMAGVAAGR